VAAAITVTQLDSSGKSHISKSGVLTMQVAVNGIAASRSKPSKRDLELLVLAVRG